MKKVLMLFLLVSCSTPYQSAGIRGGFSDQKISSDMYRISFQGNGFTSPEKVQEYLLKRCAEMTLKNGFTHFLVVNGNSDTQSSYLANHQANLNDGQMNGFSQISTTRRHSSTAVIKMINNPSLEMAAYDASIIFGPLKTRETASLPGHDSTKEIK